MCAFRYAGVCVHLLLVCQAPQLSQGMGVTPCLPLLSFCPPSPYIHPLSPRALSPHPPAGGCCDSSCPFSRPSCSHRFGAQIPFPLPCTMAPGASMHQVCLSTHVRRVVRDVELLDGAHDAVYLLDQVVDGLLVDNLVHAVHSYTRTCVGRMFGMLRGGMQGVRALLQVLTRCLSATPQLPTVCTYCST